MLAESDDPGHKLQNVSKPRELWQAKKPSDRVKPVVDAHNNPVVYQRFYAMCKWCAEDLSQRRSAEPAVGQGSFARAPGVLEPDTWWKPWNFKLHEDSQRHKDAVKHHESGTNGSIERSMDQSAAAAAQQSENRSNEQKQQDAQIALQDREQRKSIVRTVLKQAFTATAFSDLEIEMSLQDANGANVATPGKYGSEDTKHGARELTIFMSNLEKDHLRKRVQAADYWTFCADGSADRSMEHCVAILVIWIESDGTVYCALWDIVDCAGDSASLYAMLRDEFVGLDDHKLMGGSLDGASVNFGSRKGIANRFARVNVVMIWIHCAGHRVALCAQKASTANEFALAYLNTTQRLFRRYAWSGNRRSDLKEVCKELDIKYLAPKLVHKVRFLSVGNQVGTL
eukprot:COSAG06_NODE_10283_length_1711_cov_1.601737_2_plen_397_part_01